jgi:predicted dehydrogenase
LGYNRRVANSSVPLPIAVVGCGRMGRLHARVCSQMPAVRLVGVHDVDAAAAATTAGQFNTCAFDDLDALLAEVAAVLIAVPTVHHPAIALRCLERGIACLIEKPLAADSAAARRIMEAARRGDVCVQVGHIERFNPAVRAMARLNIKPRFMEVTRISPLSFRSIDVGVVLDMMIHDIDIVLQLAASELAAVSAVGVSVLGAGSAEDVCNARLSFANGCVANLTASRLALKTERKLRVFSPDAYVSLDYQKKYAMVARRGGNLAAIRDAVEQIRAGKITDLSQLHFEDLVQVEELAIDDVEPARAQLESFVDCVVNHRPPLVGAAEGLAAVAAAERILSAMQAEPL